MSLSKSQYIGMVVGVLTSASLSIMGSACIVSLVLRRRYHGSQRQSQGRTRTYDTIVGLLSATDLIFSVAMVLQIFMIPEGTPGAYLAVGSIHSCTAVGFITLFGMILVAAWNACLALYFFLTVRRGWREQDFTCRLRVLAIVLMVVPALLIAGTVAYSDGYNFSTTTYTCMMGDYPSGCLEIEGVECERGQYSSIIAVPLLATTLAYSLTGFSCTFAAYWRVRSTLKQTMRRNSQWTAMRESIPSNHVPRTEGADRLTPSAESGDTSECPSESQHVTLNMQEEQPKRPRLQKLRSSCTTQSSSFRPSTVSSSSSQEERLKQTSRQAILYSLAYANVFIWPFVAKMNRTMNHTGDVDEYDGGAGYYIPLLLSCWFFPIQGFLNAIIFMRLDVIRLRKSNPSKSMLWAFWQVGVLGKEASFTMSRRSTAGRREFKLEDRIQECEQVENVVDPLADVQSFHDEAGDHGDLDGSTEKIETVEGA